MKNHKLLKEIRQEYAAGGCLCGTWSVFHNQGRSRGFDRVGYIKSEYKKHLEIERGEKS